MCEVDGRIYIEDPKSNLTKLADLPGFDPSVVCYNIERKGETCHLWLSDMCSSLKYYVTITELEIYFSIQTLYSPGNHSGQHEHDYSTDLGH